MGSLNTVLVIVERELKEVRKKKLRPLYIMKTTGSIPSN